MLKQQRGIPKAVTKQPSPKQKYKEPNLKETQCRKFEILRKLKTDNARNQDKYVIISNQYIINF